MQLFADLERRRRSDGPIRVAVLGTGYFGSGLIRRLAAVDGLAPIVAANRSVDRAVAALRSAGFDSAAIAVCDAPVGARRALAAGRVVATDRLGLAAALPEVEVVMEATGDLLAGAEAALAAIEHCKHFVAANTEVQATLGRRLKQLADRAGVVYSDVAGDEPGLLTALVERCRGLGLRPVVAGNCKGVLKRYATPASQQAFAELHGLKPWLAAAAADGTKLNLEMAVVANATGLPPARTGMHGLQTSLGTLVEDFRHAGLLDRGPIVEYTLGIPNGVFVVIESDDPAVRRDFRYLKLGDGPYYLLHEPNVLIHYEAPLSAAAAALYGRATVAPRPEPVAEVAAFAKQDLPAGRRLDGIGGFDTYGLIARAETARAEHLLPVCLAGFARLARGVARDEPITWDAVDVEQDNLALRLRREQDAEPAAAPTSVGGPR